MCFSADFHWTPFHVAMWWKWQLETDCEISVQYTLEDVLKMCVLPCWCLPHECLPRQERLKKLSFTRSIWPVAHSFHVVLNRCWFVDIAIKMSEVILLGRIAIPRIGDYPYWPNIKHILSMYLPYNNRISTISQPYNQLAMVQKVDRWWQLTANPPTPRNLLLGVLVLMLTFSPETNIQWGFQLRPSGND